MAATYQRLDLLFTEDFRAFPLGAISCDYTPLREYHFFVPGYTGRWYEGTLVSSWRHKERWHVVDEDGQPALEQVTVLEGAVSPLFVTGDQDWEGYVLRAVLRPFSTHGRTGVVFLYRHSLDFLALVTTDDHLQLVRMDNTRWHVLAEAPFQRDGDARYVFEVDLTGATLVARVGTVNKPSATARSPEGAGDGETLVTLTAPAIPGRRGKIGLLSENPARFYWVEVWSPPATKQVWAQRCDQARRELEEARSRYPRPVLARVIDTPGFGAGKAIRFGDLDGDGRLEMVIAQNQPRVRGDSYDMISCLTAITLEGEILWQLGRPSPRHALLTNDVPLQVYDIDGDGADEVVCARDFRMQILDGRTDEVRREAPTPRSRRLEKPFGFGSEDAYYRIVGDCVHLCNVRGLPWARDILIKDRYNNVWVYDDQFNLLWSTSCRTGHFPFSYDFNGDGRDELLIGYRMYSADGEVLWDLGLGDHADGLGLVPRENGDILITIAAGDEGFLFVDREGRILRHEKLGHVQTVNVGNFRPDLPGLEFITITYWRYPGILSFYDAQGELLYRTEPYPVGSHIKPVNWTGLGDELILFSASATLPGLLDGFGRSVLNLPADGHLELCCEALDLLGDPRDEIVAWDPGRIFIYTQEEAFQGERIYAPVRPPHHNNSNYRCEISLPAWKPWPPART